jgi:hypothetical protein
MYSKKSTCMSRKSTCQHENACQHSFQVEHACQSKITRQHTAPFPDSRTTIQTLPTNLKIPPGFRVGFSKPGPLIDHHDNFKLNQSEWHRQWSGPGHHEDHHHYPSPSHRLYFVTVMARLRPWLPACVCFFVFCNPSRHYM